MKADAIKVLVTGSNGFLGSALVERLLVHGVKRPRCLVRAGSNRSKLDAVQARHPNKPIELVEGSLTSAKAAGKLMKDVDVVFHVAATMSGGAADMFMGTVVASKHLLEAIPRNTKVVLVSSFGVYGPASLPKGAMIDEQTPLEPHPEKRDTYSHTKRRQEQLFIEHAEKHGTPLSILRPGVIYGPGGGAMSGRVGLQLPGIFLFLGGDNLLPLSYVDNCAEALVVAALQDESVGEIYNVHDNDLVTARQYLRRFKREVRPVRAVPVPFPLLMLGSHIVKRYHAYSQGQLPAIFTPYKTNTMWKGHRFDNGKLERLGWKQVVSTEEALQRTFAYLREQHLQKSPSAS